MTLEKTNRVFFLAAALPAQDPGLFCKVQAWAEHNGFEITHAINSMVQVPRSMIQAASKQAAGMASIIFVFCAAPEGLFTIHFGREYNEKTLQELPAQIKEELDEFSI